MGLSLSVFAVSIGRENNAAGPIGNQKIILPSSSVVRGSPSGTDVFPSRLTAPRDESVALKTLIEEARKTYGKKEAGKTEGLLWVDRKGKKFVVTLGAIHGLKLGEELVIYDGQEKLGQMKTRAVFDVISYAQPMSVSDIFRKDYYRVVLKTAIEELTIPSLK